MRREREPNQGVEEFFNQLTEEQRQEFFGDASADDVVANANMSRDEASRTAEEQTGHNGETDGFEEL